MTKQKRTDMKEEIFDLIKLNSEDGCTMCDVTEHFFMGITQAKGFVTELQIDNRIRKVKKGRFMVYKVVEI